MGGENLYQFAPNTLIWIDSLGLANCIYSITKHSLTCKSSNPRARNISHSIDANCIHSGRDEHKNNPASSSVKDYGPIWPGLFTMKPNNNRPGWYALQEPNWGKLDSLMHYLGFKRAGANLHLGSVSHGCITVAKDAGRCQEQFNKMINFLDEEISSGYSNLLRVIE